MPSDAPKPGHIIVVRHGEPDADRYERMDWRGYENWWGAYDEAGLKAGQIPRPELLRETGQAVTRFASTLPRAIETARACCGSADLIIDSTFIEAPLPPPTIPGTYKARTWGVYARCTWWLGQSRGRETRSEAEVRAGKASDMLIEAAHEGPVVLFAHGWFNRMVRPQLRRRGWRCVRDGGDEYWSWRRYEIKK